MSVSPKYLLTECTETQALDTLREQWSALATQHRYPSAFLTHQWIDAAWQWQSPGTHLRLVTARQDDQLIAACPFVIRRDRRYGISVRTIEFLNIPDTQECDILCARNHESEFARSLAKLLVTNLTDWDLISLNLLREDAYALQMLPEALKSAGLHTSIDRVTSNPSVPLSGSWQDYYRTRSRRLKKGNNLIANRLQRKYQDIQIRHFQPGSGDMEMIRKSIEHLTELSASSWKGRDTGNTFDQPGPREFLNRLMARMPEIKGLSIWFLELDSTPVASELQLSHEGTISALRSDFRQELRDDSPGTYLNWKLLERMFDMDSQVYRMGPGSNTYKARWSVQDSPLYRLTVFNNTLVGQSIRLTETCIKPALRKLRQSQAG